MVSYLAFLAAIIITAQDDEIKETCDVSEFKESDRYDPDRDYASVWQDVCELVHQYNFDWTLFIQAMLREAAQSYGDNDFVDTLASPENRILPLQNTHLLVLAALVPNSRIRRGNATTTVSADTAVYLGYDNVAQNDQDHSDSLSTFFTTVLSACYVVQDQGSQFWYGSEDRTAQLQTYLAPTPTRHSWNDWRPFFLFPGNGGTMEIDSVSLGRITAPEGDLRIPYGGPNETTVLQIAAISSAAAGNGSPLVPSVYTQVLSIGYFIIKENKVKTVWRVLAGIAAGLGAYMFFYLLVARGCVWWCTVEKDKTTAEDDEEKPDVEKVQKESYVKDAVLGSTTDDMMKEDRSAKGVHNDNGDGCIPNEARTEKSPNDHTASDIQNGAQDTDPDLILEKADNMPKAKERPTKCCSRKTYRIIGICCGTFSFIGFGFLTFLLYGLGSIFIPTAFGNAVDRVYQNPNFDNFAVCSQWPNPCGERDGFFVDGWFIDNPALVVNVGHVQQKGLASPDIPLKVILTNTNDSWDTSFHYTQFLLYFSTHFNQGVPPGGFLWAPGNYAPYRSPQIFEEYLDEAGLEALWESIPDSNMTTALLRGTTLDNPSFGVTKGQPVEILLLNLNEPITTFVVGAQIVRDLTQPLANMTAHIASSQVLVQRVRDFANS